MSKLLERSGVVVVLSILAASAVGDTIGNFPLAPTQLASFDQASTWSTMGQVFTAPGSASHYLTRFSFLADSTSASASFAFDVRVIAWDTAENRPSGSTLFQSGTLQSTHAYQDSSSMQRFDVSIPSLNLTPNSSYIALLTRNGHSTIVGAGDLLLGARLVSSPNGNMWKFGGTGVPDPAGGPNPFTGWNRSYTGDMSYELQFDSSPLTVVPSPLASGLGAAGIGLAWCARRRAARSTGRR
jgi:hypothetical protein